MRKGSHPSSKIKVCLYCKKKFWIRNFQIRRGGGKYCSIKHHAEARKIKRPTREILYNKYWKDEKSTTQIGKEFSVHGGTIITWMKEMQIARRTISKAVSLIQIGTKHTKKWNEAISKGHKNMKPEIRKKQVLAVLRCNRNYITRSKGGIRSDIEIYVRSGWEANICRYLIWLKQQRKIKDWKYEVDTFEFPIKRGGRFYTPDFKIIENDNSIAYWEVKGYFDQPTKTRLKRFKKYYPKEFKNFTIIIWDPWSESKSAIQAMKFLEKLEIPPARIESYKEIEDKLGGLIPNWE